MTPDDPRIKRLIASMAREMYIASEDRPAFSARTDWVKNRVPKDERRRFFQLAESAIPAVLRFLDRYDEGYPN